MKTANYFLGLASAAMGVSILIVALGRGGFSPTAGSIFGGLLLMNGILRLRMARTQAASGDRKGERGRRLASQARR